jgi:DNA modification methylase
VIHILEGDTRHKLQCLASGSVHCVITSPPYYGLRDYGVDGQIGLERTPEQYVSEIVHVMRGVRRVLREDGTCWLNLGDSYNNFRPQMGPGQGMHGRQKLNGKPDVKSRARGHAGLKEKDLMMIPARVALALQADGWTLRSDVIWSKTSCMPESVTDRPTNAHEHVFLLSRSERYFYDAAAIAERAECDRMRGPAEHPDKVSTNGNGGLSRRPLTETRNARNVWSIGTQPFPGGHFAVMPAELAERCIKAGTSEHGVCAACGTPWKRIAHRGQSDYARLGKVKKTRADSTPNGYGQTRNANGVVPSLRARPVITTDWKRGCRCEGAGVVPATVLDPFAGAFTTALAADRLGRHAIGIELNARYCKLARERIEHDAGLFAQITQEAAPALPEQDDLFGIAP